MASRLLGYLLQCPDDLLRQVYFFQFLRPADGIIHRTSRLYDILCYSQAWLTVRAGLAGALLLSPLSLVRQETRRWWVVLAWAGYALALVLANRSYWSQYYVLLAVPLSLLGGGLLDGHNWSVFRGHGATRHTTGLSLGLLAFLVILFIGLAGGSAWKQYEDTVHMMARTSTTYLEVAEYLNRSNLPGDRVLVFEPNYSFLASRPAAGALPGRFLVDSYGEMLYVNLGIQQESLPALTWAVLTGDRDSGEDLQHAFWRTPAQEQVLAALDRAEYVVIDGRARYQLQPATLATIQSRSREVLVAGVASLWQRR